MRDRDDDDGRHQKALIQYRDVLRAEEAIEEKYLLRLSEPRDVESRQRIDALVAQIGAVLGGHVEHVREAWHLWRAKDSQQPESFDIRLKPDLQAAIEKNLAYATLLNQRSSPESRVRQFTDPSEDHHA